MTQGIKITKKEIGLEKLSDVEALIYVNVIILLLPLIMISYSYKEYACSVMTLEVEQEVADSLEDYGTLHVLRDFLVLVIDTRCPMVPISGGRLGFLGFFGCTLNCGIGPS